jgi:hypothetical protein
MQRSDCVHCLTCRRLAAPGGNGGCYLGAKPTSDLIGAKQVVKKSGPVAFVAGRRALEEALQTKERFDLYVLHFDINRATI